MNAREKTITLEHIRESVALVVVKDLHKMLPRDNNNNVKYESTTKF